MIYSTSTYTHTGSTQTCCKVERSARLLDHDLLEFNSNPCSWVGSPGDPSLKWGSILFNVGCMLYFIFLPHFVWTAPLAWFNNDGSSKANSDRNGTARSILGFFVRYYVFFVSTLKEHRITMLSFRNEKNPFVRECITQDSSGLWLGSQKHIHRTRLFALFQDTAN